VKTIRVGAAMALAGSSLEALDDAWRQAVAQLAGAEPDVIAVFASAHHAPEAARIADELAVRAPSAAVLGACVADGVIGEAHELEEEAGIAVWAAALPDHARVIPLHLSVAEGPHGELVLTGWPDLDLLPEPRYVLAIADPYSFPVEPLLLELADVPVIGGLAGLGSRGAARLFWTGGLAREGVVGIAIGGVAIEPLVSQGAKPIGPELTVTSAEGNTILELAGQPAIDKLQEVVDQLTPADRALAMQGLMLGLVIEENRAEHGIGDFLIRGLVGVDQEQGGLVIGDLPRVGQLVRFHVRDEQSADAELRAVLGLATQPVAGVLLFSCNGRGSAMFSAPDHDARLVFDALDGPPVAGMFCQGEIGPVGGRAFLHAFTATMAVFSADTP
jgi:small ligand-binding sensory domain FIST